jgi:hypothetical protein
VGFNGMTILSTDSTLMGGETEGPGLEEEAEAAWGGELAVVVRPRLGGDDRLEEDDRGGGFGRALECQLGQEKNETKKDTGLG